MLEIVFTGAMLSGGLIVAIGSQNMFVLRQGLLKNNVFVVSFICFACDLLLMSLGVMGLGILVTSSKVAMYGLSLGGAVFLYYYGLVAFRRAYAGKSQVQAGLMKNGVQESLYKTILTTLAITLLNPHVYLDTVVIVGGIAGTLNTDEKLWFLTGTLIASFTWFFGLGYGARIAIPLFRKAVTWKILDLGIGIIMLWIATKLLFFVFT